MVECIISAWASNVVCSAVSGNAKASISGTDDRQFPRFFMLVLTDKLIRLVNREQAGRKVLLIR